LKELGVAAPREITAKAKEAKQYIKDLAKDSRSSKG
jgi:sRNA-binding carbon storage regulator CsrA